MMIKGQFFLVARSVGTNPRALCPRIVVYIIYHQDNNITVLLLNLHSITSLVCISLTIMKGGDTF